MNRSRVLPAAVSFAAAAALLLTGCGGGDKGSGNDKIAGADGGEAKKTAAPSKPATSKVPGIDRPDVRLPGDVKFVFPVSHLSDPDQAAALGDAENFIRAIEHGIVKQDKNDAAYKFYSEFQSPAQEYARDQIAQHVEAGMTVTGERKYYESKVQSVDGKKTAVVTFCSDGSKLYSKNVKSGDVTRTTKSVKDFYFWQIGMSAADGVNGLWRAKEIKVQAEAAQCM
ncbi:MULTISPECIES: hypothetical protein [unclassified Streptomyces]|uniref:hypothetical protein n=1 Tax=unclassified Streptomyces TaxID=2593676 RepID=UPI002E212AB9|nr:hypothetical protein OG217_10405 [Streptomyces sp. NBC_01023]